MRDFFRFLFCLINVFQEGSMTCFTAQKWLRNWRWPWRQGTEVRPKLKKLMKSLRDQILASCTTGDCPLISQMTCGLLSGEIVQGLCHKKDNWRFKWGPFLESKGLSKDLPHKEQELQPLSHARHPEKWLAAYWYQARKKQFKKKKIHTHTNIGSEMGSHIHRISLLVPHF